MKTKLKRFRSYRYLRATKVDKAVKERTHKEIEREQQRNGYRRFYAHEFLALR